MMSQRTKNILLILGFIGVLIFSYQFSIKKTLDLKKEVRLLQAESEQFRRLPQLSANLMQREKFLDSVLASNSFKSNSIQNNLLEFLNQSSKDRNLSISSFEEPHTYSENNVTTTSYSFVLKGSYGSILEVVYDLEQRYNFGRIVHVNFEKKRDLRKRTNFLECSVIIENLL